MRRLVVLVLVLLVVPVCVSAQEPVEDSQTPLKLDGEAIDSVVTTSVEVPVEAVQPTLKIDWKAVAFIVAGQTADLVSTLRYLNNGSGCVERNPVMGYHPSHTKLVITKSIIMALNTAAVIQLTKEANDESNGPKRRKFDRIAAKVLGYSVGAWGVGAAAFNIGSCGL